MSEENKICSVFGHRGICVTEELQNELSICFEKLIKDGYSTFYFGGFGEFDDLCHKIITKLKIKYPHIRRVFILADPRYVNKKSDYLTENYEESIYLDMDFDYWYSRIYFRNVEMVKQSNFIVFYAFNKEKSGAYKILQYAKKAKKDYINFAEQTNNLLW